MSDDETNDGRAPGRLEISPITFGAFVLIYILMGVSVSAYGPLFSALSTKFEVPLSTAGEVVSVHFVGAFVGLVASMLISARVRSIRLIVSVMLCFGVGCLGVALSHAWPLLLASVFVLGVGWGGLNLEMNQVLARSMPERRAVRLNIVNGGFGSGAVLGPLFVAILKDSALTWEFLGLSVVAAGLIPTLWNVKSLPHREWAEVELLPLSPSGTGPSKMRDSRIIAALLVFGILVYVGVETSVGSWAPTYLMSLGYTQRAAAVAVTFFWAALAIGRFLAVPVVAKISSRRIVLIAMSAAVVTLAASAVSHIALGAIILTGLAVAPIFPMALAWIVISNPGNPRVSSRFLVASTIGEFAIPAVVRYGVSVSSASVIPLILVGGSAIAWMLFFGAAMVQIHEANKGR